MYYKFLPPAKLSPGPPMASISPAGTSIEPWPVVEWGNPHPWVMRGFPGESGSLAWSDSPTVLALPLLAVASAEGVVIWEKQIQEEAGWEGWVLEGHRENVTGIEFQPGTFLLASGSEEGAVCLWHSAEKIIQTLEDGVDGFSCLSWHPRGQFSRRRRTAGRTYNLVKVYFGTGVCSKIKAGFFYEKKSLSLANRLPRIES